MADEKKPESKPAPAPAPSWFSHPDPFVEIVWGALSIFVILYVINEVLNLINSGHFSNFGPELVKKIIDLFNKIFSIFKYISILLSLILIGSAVYLFNKLTELRLTEAIKMYPKVAESEGVGELHNPHWEKILNHIESQNESDWRLAILEADIILDGLLHNLGLQGDTMADRLKAVEKSDFTTIDNAWEAHKIRNQVAHEGSTFLLSQHEAKRVIALYQTVFEEFRII
jgi:hypothetical protein